MKPEGVKFRAYECWRLDQVHDLTLLSPTVHIDLVAMEQTPHHATRRTEQLDWKDVCLCLEKGL